MPVFRRRILQAVSVAVLLCGHLPNTILHAESVVISVGQLIPPYRTLLFANETLRRRNSAGQLTCSGLPWERRI